MYKVEHMHFKEPMICIFLILGIANKINQPLINKLECELMTIGLDPKTLNDL